MILDIHLEYCDDRGERLKELIKTGKPFNLSLVPVLLLPEHEIFKNKIYPSDYCYPPEIIDILKDLSKNKDITFGQQGFTHYCSDCYEKFLNNKRKLPDPWHENLCLYGKTKSVEDQIKFMQEGKKTITKILGISPIIYCPPNHQYNMNTLLAAKQLGYKYFSDRNILNLPAYKLNNLIIIPESKLGESNIVYTHYDQIKENFDEYLQLLNKSDSLKSIKPRNIDDLLSCLIVENERLKLMHKFDRDIKKKKI